MKKAMKTVLVIVAVVTAAVIAAAVYMLNAVSDDSLMYMDSRIGSICAAAYRWTALAAVVLVVFWIVFIIRNRSRLSFKGRKKKVKTGEKAVPEAIAEPEPTEISVPEEPEKPAERICPECGAVVAPEKKFCNKCGTRLSGEE